MKNLISSSLAIMIAKSANTVRAGDNVEMSNLYNSLIRSNFLNDAAAGTNFVHAENIRCEENKTTSASNCQGNSPGSGRTLQIQSPTEFIKSLKQSILPNDAAVGTDIWHIKELNCRNFNERESRDLTGFGCEAKFEL